jgi:putative flavoprotein involved in K+ transport
MERYGTVVVGGGQAGLSAAHHLGRHGETCVVLEAGDRVGDQWRSRWGSLRLFSPAKYDGLDGRPFPAPPWSFPTGAEMADYLEEYAAALDAPVRTGVRVDGVAASPDGWVVTAGDRRFAARNVVLATGTYQVPHVPAFAEALDARIAQLHSSRFRDASQLPDGDVLVVGASTSGADIALQARAAGHRVLLAGRHPGQIPFDIDGLPARLVLARFVLRFVFHRVLTLRTPMGRAVRPQVVGRGGPLIRYRSKDLAAAGVERAPRVSAVRGGRPVLADGRVLDVASVVWATGYDHDYGWVDAPGTSTDDHGVPAHDRGVVAGTDGLYLVGLHFLYAMSSQMIHGVGRDAAHVAAHIARRSDERPGRRPGRRVVSPRSGHGVGVGGAERSADGPARPAARRG